MRVVIDCNVLVAAARIDGLCRQTLVTVIRDHEIVLSEPIAGIWPSKPKREEPSMHEKALMRQLAERHELMADLDQYRFELLQRADHFAIAITEISPHSRKHVSWV